MIPRVHITEDMKAQARVEANKRNDYIKHHFEVGHLTSSQRDEIGFLGEFACCDYLGIDWKENIRGDYLTIDDFDFKINNKRVDVKTETVPAIYAKEILTKQISDDGIYGRRLINKGQFSLLNKYDVVIFSLFVREHLDYWFPIGYVETKIILDKYKPTYDRPDGGKYPFAASAVPTSILKDIKEL